LNGHAETLSVLTDVQCYPLEKMQFSVIADKNCDPAPFQYALEKGAVEYENFLETGDPDFPWKPLQDECILPGVTLGTTASPKGVVLHHRGAYLMALSNAVVWRQRGSCTLDSANVSLQWLVFHGYGEQFVGPTYALDR
ncbi:Acetate/butyrate--CoA ligase aae7, peroxisomal, partial [Datura stramonium]|nr:Acetate/butyrate--CoA ligase aae7, peroxisomal [Datura stramonium]